MALPRDFMQIGENRMARTWSILSSYEQYRTVRNTACGTCIMNVKGSILTVYNTAGGSFAHIKIKPLMMIGESLDWIRTDAKNASDKAEIVVNEELLNKVLDERAG